MAALVIVGSGLGGYTLARELRKHDRTRAIVVVTQEAGDMYAKPMLSNAFQQKKRPDGLIARTAAEIGRELAITVRAGTTALAIDRAARILRTDQGEIAYDRLVLAIGADPRPCPVDGADTLPIFTVNDLASYRRWRDAIEGARRILLIGAGLIGCEFANDLALGGHAVTLVDPAPWPLGRLAPEMVGRAMEAALVQAGIEVRSGRGVTRVEQNGPSCRAILDDGGEIAFDRALSAIGLVPRLDLAREAGLAVGRGGILVDRLLKTSDPFIHALGDCAETPAGPQSFVLPLMAEAKALAATLAGKPTPLMLPALPVVVKTPALPVAVCPPPAGRSGAWVVEGDGFDLRALFKGEDGTVLGFALAGTRTQERQTLAKAMPPLLLADPAEAAVLP